MTPEDRSPVDGGYVPWSPLPERPPLRWPGQAPVAVCFLVHVERIPISAPGPAVIGRSVTHRGPYPAIADLHEVTPHEYGNRVGLFRVLDLLGRHDIAVSAPIDAAVLTGSERIVSALLDQRCELLGHAPQSHEVISQEMTEEAEWDYLRRSLDPFEQVVGARPRGWAGVEYAESSRTVELLARAGLDIVCDWPSDEQPFEMTVPAGRMTCLPVSVHLDDIFAMRLRGIDPAVWADSVCRAFDRLCVDGRRQGRTLVLGLHPWFVGQPHRIGYLDQVVRHLAGSGQAWFATATQIVDRYRVGVPGTGS